jgi:hypothetical protein
MLVVHIVGLLILAVGLVLFTADQLAGRGRGEAGGKVWNISVSGPPALVLSVIGVIVFLIPFFFGDDEESVAQGTTTIQGTTTTTTGGVSAPNIAGDYFLDPDNSRVILVKSVGQDSYSVEEQLPANWPFFGTVEWTGSNVFAGIATFDSGSRMRVTLEPMPDGTLYTQFDFVTNDQGVSIERVDEHLLTPIG